MDKELKRIKKLYGEAMMHFCRDNLATILETPDLLLSILTSNFYPTHELYHDLEENNLMIYFKNFIFQKIKNDSKITKFRGSPKALMAQAGYDLYECLTEDDIQKFRKYYAKHEELCTFWTNRLNDARVFFAVKKNVEEIKREDFPNPSRQDEYGTSVISIQFTKDGTNTLSIKNRYNHTVDNPDATFSNNLDSIITGLTDSFEEYYDLKQLHKSEDFEIPGYVMANDGKYYKYNYEINNCYYCPDNIIIDNYSVKKYEKEKYLILDYFTLDLVTKRINFVEDFLNYGHIDGFPETIGEIKKLDIKNEGEEKKVLITPIDGEVIEIDLDKLNRIIRYKNNNIREIGPYFLYYNECLTNIELNNVETIEQCFLKNNLNLENLNLPRVCYIKGRFLEDNRKLKELYLPSLITAGSYFLYSNKELEKFDAPNLKEVSYEFLYNNLKLVSLYLPKLEKVGSYFLAHNKKLKKIDAPHLKISNDYFLYSTEELVDINLFNLEIVGDCFLKNNKILKNLKLPNLKIVGDDFFKKNINLEIVELPKLEKVGSDFLYECFCSLRVFIAPNLKETNDYNTLASFFKHHPKLETFITADSNISLQRKLD